MNNSKIVSIKRFSAIFLAIVLFTGTIAAISPSSFIIKGVNAQGDSYYGYNSYGPEYPDNNYYNSYESDYGMDNNDRKSYGDDIYESQYQPSYKPDYKAQYPSYDGKDTRDKSKDSSDIINKIKCTTNNIVINGNNTGDINIGNKGGIAAEEGDWSASSSGSGGYDGERYNDGYNNKKDKGIECIIENNNIINNIIAGAGNATNGNGNGNVTLTCEECFTEILTPAQISDLEDLFSGGGIVITINLLQYRINSFAVFCEILEVQQQLLRSTLIDSIRELLNPIDPDPSPQTISEIIDCVAEALGI